MLEVSSVRKNKVCLTDYNCQQDIDNRMLMADSSTFDLEVLGEILFSPLKISIMKLVRSMGCEERDLFPILKKLSKPGLLSIQDDFLIVDKELRKYFEFQIVRFDPEFKPDMEFLSALLKKVPIHHLPAWYSIPRTSNNIFESIVEKYLLTPQIFQRYLADLHFNDPMIHRIMDDLFSSPDFKLYSSDVIEKYNLVRRTFEETMLLFEFNFIGCVSFEKADDHWVEIITPFYEWRQYLLFLKATETPRLPKNAPIFRRRCNDFSFLEDMVQLLTIVSKKPLSLPTWQPGNPLPRKSVLELAPLLSLDIKAKENFCFASHYLETILQKLILMELAFLNEQKIIVSNRSSSWLEMNYEKKAIYLYRHPKNRILNLALSSKIATERNIREAEKSLKRILHGDWVFFDDFLKGVLVTFSEHSVVMLKRVGKHWKYSLPIYSDDEKNLLKATIFEWLFEIGIVVTGTCQGRDCFAVTPFGRFFFEQ